MHFKHFDSSNETQWLRCYFQPLYFAFTNCSTKSALILIENGADPWLEVKNRPIYEYWGKKAKTQIEMDPKLKDYIEQLKPETFEFESTSDDEE